MELRPPAAPSSMAAGHPPWPEPKADIRAINSLRAQARSSCGPPTAAPGKSIRGKYKMELGCSCPAPATKQKHVTRAHAELLRLMIEHPYADRTVLPSASDPGKGADADGDNVPADVYDSLPGIRKASSRRRPIRKVRPDRRHRAAIHSEVTATSAANRARPPSKRSSTANHATSAKTAATGLEQNDADHRLDISDAWPRTAQHRRAKRRGAAHGKAAQSNAPILRQIERRRVDDKKAENIHAHT